jgi:hypothetical protein
VLIVPSEEVNGFDVAWLAQDPRVPIDGKQGDLTEHVGLSLEMACSWAEEVLEDMGGSAALILAGAKKPWRRQQPSAAQELWCRRRGIDPDGKTKGEISDLMSVLIASARVDPVIGFLAMTREDLP